MTTADNPQWMPSSDQSTHTEEGPARWRYLLYGFCFKIRGLLAVLLLFAMFFTTWGRRGSAALNWAIGLTLFGAAWALRIRSQQYLRYRLREDGGLATSGPYAYVRNPVYIANITGLGALCIMCGLYWMTPIAVAWAAIVYHLAVRFEEIRLSKRFGEPYREYLRTVPRWIPRGSPTAAAGARHAGFWRAARVEWQNLLLLLVPLAKEWGFGRHGGEVHAVLRRLVALVAAHAYASLVLLAVILVALAAWNLNELRKAKRRRARRAESAGAGRGSGSF